jgi:hypothetical protein
MGMMLSKGGANQVTYFKFAVIGISENNTYV